MATRAEDSADADLVTLGFVDVRVALLAAPGRALSDVLDPRPLDDSVSAELLESMPTQGWRQVAEIAPPGRARASRIFAAPSAEDPSGWALLNLAVRDDRWLVNGDPGPVYPRPGQASRRAGLSLRWPGPDRPGAVQPLGRASVELVNTATEPWLADSEDSSYVHGWLLDAEGRRMRSSWIAYPPGRALPHLDPGEVVRLPVEFGHGDRIPAAGQYGATAVLVSLDLWSDRGSIRVRQPGANQF